MDKKTHLPAYDSRRTEFFQPWACQDAVRLLELLSMSHFSARYGCTDLAEVDTQAAFDLLGHAGTCSIWSAEHPERCTGDGIVKANPDTQYLGLCDGCIRDYDPTDAEIYAALNRP